MLFIIIDRFFEPFKEPFKVPLSAQSTGQAQCDISYNNIDPIIIIILVHARTWELGTHFFSSSIDFEYRSNYY
jgi:hypothetical protein